MVGIAHAAGSTIIEKAESCIAMFYLLFKQFIRAKSTVMALALLLIAGVISMATGKQYLEKQKSNIERASALQQEHLRRNVSYYNNELGLLMYHLRFAFVNEIDPLNVLSVGQRDVNSSVQNINIRNLEAQRYDTDLTNPVSLHAGNLDLGFVIIYLFPLVIIAFVYNLLSEEKEAGALKLWLVQSQKPIRFLRLKLFIRMLAVYIVLFLLLMMAFVWLDLPLHERTIAFCTVAVLYLLFWFAIAYWVVSWKKNSNINAVVLLSIWVMLTIVIPASLNNYINNLYPLPEAQELALKQRDGYHEKWDMDKSITMQAFYKHYPQLEKFGVPGGKGFSWLWYYAMQQMGDDDAAVATGDLFNKLWKRDAVAKTLAAFVPGLHTQLAMNDLSRAGLQNQLLFLDSTARFHEKIRLQFYPKIFSNQMPGEVRWTDFKVNYFKETTRVVWGKLCLPLVLFVVIAYLLAAFNFKRNPLKNFI